MNTNTIALSAWLAAGIPTQEAPSQPAIMPMGKPVEGSELVTEQAVKKPCFVAVDPPCDGHWVLKKRFWVFTNSNWRLEHATIVAKVPVSHTIKQTSNLLTLPIGQIVYTNSLFTTNWVQLGVTSDGRIVTAP